MKDSIQLLTSLQNPKVKQVVSLRDRRDRDETGQFIIEGYRELLRAVDAKHPIQVLFMCSELFLGVNERQLIDRIQEQGAVIFSCTPPVFCKMSYRERPDGLLAIAQQQHGQLSDMDAILAAKKNPFFVAVESIEKPGNLGTILRSSDAVGLDGLIVCNRCTDLHNPNVIRSSVGCAFTVPIAEATSEETLQWLKSNNIKILAATPSATVEYTDVDLTVPLAIAVGTEQYGLSDLWMDQADLKVKIPMCGVADSLNVAMATTLLMYEALRQRSKKC